MSLSINKNILAANTSRNINTIYRRLGVSTQRLSSGLRINSSADDAAGLAIREMMRCQVASLNQGIRNANDAISLIQTADGALQVIDEKLIRMKELAMQASTGTYNSTQRAIINAEYVAMADEINRIAKSTSFNGIKLLDGSLSGEHSGVELLSAGSLKVHFGPGNDSAEDYYYLDIAKATIGGLGLGSSSASSNVANLSSILTSGDAMKQFNSGIVSFAIIPAGTTNLFLHLDSFGMNDNIEIFTAQGLHLVGTALGVASDGWASANLPGGGTGVNAGNVDAEVMTVANGFAPGASYVGTALNGVLGNGNSLVGGNFNPVPPFNNVSALGMNIGYSGDGNGPPNNNNNEFLTIDNVTQDLVIVVAGAGVFDIQGTWDFMPDSSVVGGVSDSVLPIHTQALAQQALDNVTQAIVTKDNIRAYLGAMQNRLENTVSNLQIQAENLQASESRISDVDVATEMTEFTRNQVMLQTSVAMLSQANTLPRELLKLIA